MKDIVFDKFYEDYDEWYSTKIGNFVDELETGVLFELLKPKKDMKVLDLGCGTGNMSFKLLEKGCQVTGIDISKKMLEQARAKNTENKISFLEMNGTNMDFEDNHFDAAVSMTAFEFIRNPREVYEELKRVVKPGGTIVLGTIQKGGSWEKMYSSHICKGTAYELADFKTKEDLVYLDKDNVVEVKEALYIPPGLEENSYTMESEKSYKKQEEVGGFLCVKYTVRK